MATNAESMCPTASGLMRAEYPLPRPVIRAVAPAIALRTPTTRRSPRRARALLGRRRRVRAPVSDRSRRAAPVPAGVRRVHPLPHCIREKVASDDKRSDVTSSHGRCVARPRTRCAAGRRYPRAELGEPGAHGVHASTPITGDVLFTIPGDDAGAGPDAAIGARTSLYHLAHDAGAGARRAGQAARRAARPSTRPTSPTLVTHRGRQDPLRGARRGPGDDRHLRLRGRPVAPARTAAPCLGAARAPADGDLAPARRRRRHLGVQLPGRGLGVERRVALVCGDTVVWKPSELTPLTALACRRSLDAGRRRRRRAAGVAPGS